MKSSNQGLVSLDGVIIASVFAIIGAILFRAFFNTPGRTEASAYQSAENFIKVNNLSVKRKTCAHDSDGDGQSSCTIVTTEGEKIFLSCPVGIFKTFTGAESCKEVSEMQVLSIKRR